MDIIEIPKFRSLKENKQLRRQAMSMYMSDEFFPTEIAAHLQVDINELGEYVFGHNRKGDSKSCWKYLKEQGQIPQYASTYEDVKTLYIKKTEHKLLKMANKLVDKLNSEDKLDEMQTKDLINIINSLEKVDRIGRLEEDKPTQNVVTERKSFSLRDIVASKNNPSEEPIEAKFTELPPDNLVR